MGIISSTPAADGFSMPAEFGEHEGCVMIWPKRPGSWIYGAQRARKAFAAVAEAILRSERLIVLTGEDTFASARAALPKRAEIQIIDSDDAWARDVAPTFVRRNSGVVRGVNWRFNAWGGEYDGLYASWEKDDALAMRFCEQNGFDVYDARPFVLEGGAVHTDGEGTILVTEACLLSKGRNPGLSRREIEKYLHDYLGAEKVIWLPHGIYNDETNEHVDNVCAFIRPAEVVLAWTDDPNDPQHAFSKSCLDVLEHETDARKRPFGVHKLPVPKCPICVSEEEVAGYAFEDGESIRETGERLAASYVNFYFSNGAVILPQFGGDNASSDKAAVRLMRKLCPEREIIPIMARDILLGGGNIHCITQQIPKGAKNG